MFVTKLTDENGNDSCTICVQQKWRNDQKSDKKTAAISYNSLSLPQSLTINDATHTYTYAADGRKLKVVQGSTNHDYAGNIIYENGSLKRILVDGGYIEGGVYYFNLNDHLGNTSVVANAIGTAVQRNHYYPFGLPFAETSSADQDKQPYKYNGKEFERKDGLNWMDYGARHYDAALGRFAMMDPMAEKYYEVSPYTYCLNNPMRFVDPDGKQVGVPPITVMPMPIPTPFPLPLPFFIPNKLEQTDLPKVNDVVNDTKEFVSNGVKISVALFVTAVIKLFSDLSPSDTKEEVTQPDIAPTYTLDAAKKKSSESEYNQESEHTKNKRSSKRNKHEEGKSRKQKDKGGEKGDARRTRHK